MQLQRSLANVTASTLNAVSTSFDDNKIITMPAIKCWIIVFVDYTRKQIKLSSTKLEKF